MTEPTIAMLGAGAFGTAVATALARAGRSVTLLCRTPEQRDAVLSTGRNARYYPGHDLYPSITPSCDVDAALASDYLFLAFPAKVMEDYAARIARRAHPGAVVVNLIKGMHPTHFTFAELFRRTAPDTRYVALKGPTFSRPLFLGEWSGLTCGADDPDDGERVIALFGDAPIAFDRSASADSVDVASALKNVYAIALGLVASTGPSENTVFLTATLVMREMRTILTALRCDPDVLLSFAGIGDTMLTGLCDTSRNRTLGMMIGKGIPIDLVRADFLAEGVRAVEALRAHLDGVDAPLLRAVSDVLAHHADPVRVFEVFGLK